jgi:hypothetical protein
MRLQSWKMSSVFRVSGGCEPDPEMNSAFDVKVGWPS